MNDTETLAYLQSHAPIDRFYVYAPGGYDEPLLKFVDDLGRSWNLMEDDSKIVSHAAELLMRLGAPTFASFPELIEFERQRVKAASEK